MPVFLLPFQFASLCFHYLLCILKLQPSNNLTSIVLYSSLQNIFAVSGCQDKPDFSHNIFLLRFHNGVTNVFCCQIVLDLLPATLYNIKNNLEGFFRAKISSTTSFTRQRLASCKCFAVSQFLWAGWVLRCVFCPSWWRKRQSSRLHGASVGIATNWQCPPCRAKTFRLATFATSAWTLLVGWLEQRGILQTSKWQVDVQFVPFFHFPQPKRRLRGNFQQCRWRGRGKPCALLQQKPGSAVGTHCNAKRKVGWAHFAKRCRIVEQKGSNFQGARAWQFCAQQHLHFANANAHFQLAPSRSTARCQRVWNHSTIFCCVEPHLSSGCANVSHKFCAIHHYCKRGEQHCSPLFYLPLESQLLVIFASWLPWQCTL